MAQQSAQVVLSGVGDEKVEEAQPDTDQAPKWSSAAPTESNRKFKIRIAIDFGTDGIGLAYAVNLDNVFVHTAWGNGKYQAVVKSKTIILLDDNHDTIAMGMDAKINYASVPAFKDTWLLFERFKMALFTKNDDSATGKDEEKQSGKQKINKKLTATNGKELDASVVFVAAFKHIKGLAEKMLRKKGLKMAQKDIQWIVTVPAIWDDSAKYKMRNWAIKAGLVDKKIKDQCKIVYEPDCASLSVQMERRRGGDDQKQEEPFQEGEKYLLIDAGGGTLDIACHEVVKDGNVKEVWHPSGGPWGSCYIDDQFEVLLHHLFSKEWVKEFESESPDAWIALIDNFQSAKGQFYEERNEWHNVTMPMDFVAFMQDKLDEHNDEITEKEAVDEQNEEEAEDEEEIDID